MSSLTQTQRSSEILTDAPNMKIANIHADELTINVVSSYEQPSFMKEELKKQKRENAPELAELFQNILEEKGAFSPDKSTWVGESEVVVEGLSGMTLHSFILKAEELGKSIKYTKSMKVEITD